MRSKFNVSSTGAIPQAEFEFPAADMRELLHAFGCCVLALKNIKVPIQLHGTKSHPAA